MHLLERRDTGLEGVGTGTRISYLPQSNLVHLESYFSATDRRALCALSGRSPAVERVSHLARTDERVNVAIMSV
jgi:hypothetical protein